MCQQINNNFYGNDHVILLLMSYTLTIKHWFLLIAYLMKPKSDFESRLEGLNYLRITKWKYMSYKIYIFLEVGKSFVISYNKHYFFHKLFNLYITITVYVYSMYNILWLPVEQQCIQMYALTPNFTYS